MEKFEEDLIKLKNKINSMTLSDEFKENLSQKLDEEYNKVSTKKSFFIPKQIIAVCICCIFLTSCVFAGSIGNTITNLFANTSKEMEAAIESGELKKLDMDYVERDGISIKVDYAMVKEDTIYLVFDVLSKEEITNVRFTDFKIESENDEIIYDVLDTGFNDIGMDYYVKRLNNMEIAFFLQLSNIEDIQEDNNMKVILDEIIMINKNNTKIVNNNWNFDFKI